MTNNFYVKMISMTSDVFIIGVKIASPIFVGMLLLTMVLGVLARAVTSMNIFAIGFPLKLMGGMILLLIFIETYVNIFFKVFIQFQTDVESLMYMLT